MTRAWLRPKADDLVERAAYFRSQGGGDLAERFVDAAVAALRAAERLPPAGSPRVGELCGVAGLRASHVRGFQVHRYYLLADDGLDVVRLLADAQDVVTILGDTRPD